MRNFWKSGWLTAGVFLAGLMPLGWLVWLWWSDQLGFNRIELVSRFTGNWALRMLLVSLAITPLRMVPGLGPIARFRRMTGLYAFFYASLHALHYFAIDLQWNKQVLIEDLTFRRFFIAGAISLTLMIPLALTSFDAAVRWMGGRRWRLLHRLAYVSAVAAVIHFIWQGKSLNPMPLYYALILTGLFLVRIGAFARTKIKQVRARSGPGGARG